MFLRQVIPGLQPSIERILLMNSGGVDVYEVLNDPLKYPETILPVQDLKGG